MSVSIIIPVFNKLEFTLQCLDRIARHTAEVTYDVIVVDNASSDGTHDWFTGDAEAMPLPVRYHRNGVNLGFAKANNIGAGLSGAEYLLFLNNDTLVQPGWLAAMLRIARADSTVGVVGIKQLFPYTNLLYHTGIVFAPGGVPQHLYPHLDASLPQVNLEREYQAVTGACLLISRRLFDDCGKFDEAYVNGYEDIDLCMQVRQRGRRVVCCTSACIYHYGQISEGRTAADDANAALFASRWRDKVRIDQDEYLLKDRLLAARPRHAAPASLRTLADDCIYLADDLGQGSALTWVNVELAGALADLGAPVAVRGGSIAASVPSAERRRLERLAVKSPPVGGVQIKWSHYWPAHMNLELHGRVNLEFFVINYVFGRVGAEPLDYWLQSLRQNGHGKLPDSEFCSSVLAQIGIPEHDRHVLHHGYSREIHDVEPPVRRDGRFRFLTVTNSHDLDRYGTLLLLDAYEQACAGRDGVTLVVKDYGASSGETALRDRVRHARGPRIELVTDFMDKRELIRLYRSCDAFVSAHRGEGFAMKILDAVACGLPVITPLFGGPTAYCGPDTCFPVEFTLVPVTRGMDARALALSSQALWAEPQPSSLVAQMRCVYQSRVAAADRGRRAREGVIDRFSWSHAAERLVAIAAAERDRRPKRPSGVVAGSAAPPSGAAPRPERSPYWLGVRVSVIVPTHNRREKLQRCLDALARQSVLPQEFEVIVVDDGSNDGTQAMLEARHDPYPLRYYWQDQAGPGAARNRGIAEAAGEIVLFIGDDIYADRRLLEEHLLAHAADATRGAAMLGHIDWPPEVAPNAVMDYVCGDASLQFAYTRIPTMPVLDHRFFYTSNISLKRQFLVEAAVTFDPGFTRAAFEDAELAYRLIPHGLSIRYVPTARAVHDHWMDLTSFARREHAAGEMAVVFYRKHPGEDQQLQVREVVDLAAPASALLARPELLTALEAFDAQTDALLTALAGSLEALMAIQSRTDAGRAVDWSNERVRAALHNVLRLIFDVQRTRGKLQAWYDLVDDPARARAAQTLTTVLRKIEFLQWQTGPGPLNGAVGSLDARTMAALAGGLASMPGGGSIRLSSRREGLGRRISRLVATPAVVSRLVWVDRRLLAWLDASAGPAWTTRYRQIRGRLRRVLP